jgi:hypothetical protein
MGLFKNIFGGKSWYQSLTAWGLVVLVTASGVETALADQCAAGALGGFVCAKALPGLQWLGGLMATLGIRKALN